MLTEYLTVEVRLKAEFFDVDSMKVVWHGNYVKYMEQARCALLDFIGFNYQQMEENGYAWPIVSIQLKYINPIVCNQEFIIRTTLLEYENRIRISYLMFDPVSEVKINKSESIQMAVDLNTKTGLLVSPSCLVDAVKAKLNQKENH